MQIHCTKGEGEITLSLSGELGHTEALEVIHYLNDNQTFLTPCSFILDLSGLTFMDSSGIAVAMKGYREISQMGGSFLIQGAHEQAMKVFRAAGLDKIIRFQEEVKRECQKQSTK